MVVEKVVAVSVVRIGFGRWKLSSGCAGGLGLVPGASGGDVPETAAMVDGGGRR